MSAHGYDAAARADAELRRLGYHVHARPAREEVRNVAPPR